MKMLIVMLFSINTVFALSIQDNDKKICKVYTEKVDKYKKNMRKDIYAKKTLEHYIDIRDKACRK